MRMSRLFVPTLKEAPREAEIPSHQLLLRGGYIRKVAAGIYDFLPLGWRTVKKVANIVREEMDRAGAQEVLLPAVQPAELWMESGRWEQYGPELLRFQDRKDGWFALGPTHEEVITALVRHEVRSYRDLPLNLYQIQTKFRDEIRPRAGLLRGREFLMKDAYSFDADAEGARRSYDSMVEAYRRIFTRCGLEFRQVEADTGAIGGSMSHEFHVLADTGEDAIVSCPECSYTANVEKAEVRPVKVDVAEGEIPTIEEVPTPGRHTVEDIAEFLDVPKERVLKTLIFDTDKGPVAAVVPGHRDANPIKVKTAAGAAFCDLASDEVVTKATNAPVGFAGPVGLQVPILVDVHITEGASYVTGANKGETHVINVVPGRDFAVGSACDLTSAEAGDPCARCGGSFGFYRGIEVGHVFFLGTKYSEPLKATFSDQDGQERPMVMGCYGIGVTRIVAAAVEQCNDEAGIAWPVSIAPYEVTVVSLARDDEGKQAADSFVSDLEAAGVEVLYDDRAERPGVKFKDADLIGVPLHVVVGPRGLAKGVVELKERATGERVELALEGAVEAIAERVRSAR